jgi:hypothetical protein
MYSVSARRIQEHTRGRGVLAMQAGPESGSRWVFGLSRRDILGGEQQFLYRMHGRGVRQWAKECGVRTVSCRDEITAAQHLLYSVHGREVQRRAKGGSLLVVPG